MTTPRTTDTPSTPDRAGQLALIAALILGIAAVLTAWSSYRGNLTSDGVAKNYAEQQAAIAQANDAYGLADQQQSMEEQFFITYAINQAEGNQGATAYLEAAMTPELADAVEWWVGQPDSAGYPTPFVADNPAYASLPSQQAIQEGDALTAEAEAKRVLAEAADADSDRFELANVFFAIVLFLAGIATLLGRRRIQVGLLVLSGAMLLAGVAVVVTTPGWANLG